MRQYELRFFTQLLRKCLILRAIVIATVNADCYSRDGVAALDSRYYDGTELVSCGRKTNNCCLSGEKCGTNLLCVNPHDGFARQYCADKSWRGCSLLCPDAMEAGTGLTDCGNNIYCCGAANTQCCEDGSGHFVDPTTGEVKMAGNGSSSAMVTWWYVDRSIQTTTRISSSVTSETHSLSTSSFTTHSSSTSAPTPTPVSKSPSSHGLSAGAGAGIGIGATLVVASIVVSVWFLMRRRKKPQQHSSAVGYPSYCHRKPDDLGYRTYQPGMANQELQLQELSGHMLHEMR